MNRWNRRSWAIILGLTAVTAFFGFFIPKIVLDNEVKIYFPSDHPSYIRQMNLDETYGSQIFLVVAVTNPNGSIVNAKAVERIRTLTEGFEKLDGVDKVQSMTNVDYVTGRDGGLVSETLVPKDFSGSAEDLRRLNERIADWEGMYNRIIVSEDRTGSEIVITVNHNISAEKMGSLYRQVRGMVNACAGDGLEYRVAGDPVLAQMAQDYMRSDLARLVPAVALLVLLTLFFSFRTLAGTLLPLITVLFSTIWTVGLMAITGTHFTVVSSCLPVLLIAVGSAYGIHVVNHYYEDLAHDYSDRPIDRDTHTELIRSSLRKVIVPVLLAGVTTVVGFASTITSPIVPLKTFAIFSSLGVTIALIFSLVLIPALLTVRPLPKDGRLTKRVSHRNSGDNGASSNRLGVRAAALVNDFLHRRPITVGILMVLVLGLSVWGMTKIKIESALLSYFPETSQLRRDVEFIDTNFAGSNLMSIVIHGKDKGSLTDPVVLQAMDDLSTYLRTHHNEVGKTISYSDFIRRMNRIMNAPQNPSDGSAGGDTGMGSPAEGSAAASDAGTSGVVGGDSFFSPAGSDSFFSDASTPGAGTNGAAVAKGAPSAKSASVPPSDAKAGAAAGESGLGLASTMTLEEALDLFRRAYANAGPKPTVDSMLLSMEREVNYQGAAFDEIPLDPSKYPVANKGELKNLISQYLVLYSGSLNEYANDQLAPSAARIAVQFRTHNTSAVEGVIKDIHRWAAVNLPEGYTVETSGIAEMEVALTSMITSSQISSLLLAIISVFVILWISFRSPMAGLIGSIPLTLAILINFGIMGFAGINLDMVTSLISSIAIGIGVDYTIHFMSNYHHERLLSDDLQRVTFNTYMVSGKAILVNALSVALGFLVLCFSEFVVLRYIGLLVAVVMVTSSLTAMTVLPVLLNLIKPKFISRSF